MRNRWVILGVLFLARTAMAFQFQSAAALTPQMIAAYGVTLAQMGLLIGLYLAPGMLVALPGGVVAARFGDSVVVGVSLGLMLVGGALPLLVPTWDAALIGRVIAGTGGVVINIVMTKMVVDWFAGREISTALALFISSWPVGIALPLVVLTPIAVSAGLVAAQIATLALIALATLLFLALYRSAPTAAAGAAPSLDARDLPLPGITLAGLVWGLFNGALAMVFSFGALALMAGGWPLGTAAGLIGAFMIACTLGVAAGGVLADRTGAPDMVIALGSASFALAIIALLTAPEWWIAPTLVLAGLIFGLPAGPIMTLPARVLTAEARALGMGVFFTIYYAVMMAAPALGGLVAERMDDPAAAILTGGAMAVATLVALAGFRRRAAQER